MSVGISIVVLIVVLVAVRLLPQIYEIAAYRHLSFEQKAKIKESINLPTIVLVVFALLVFWQVKSDLRALPIEILFGLGVIMAFVLPYLQRTTLRRYQAMAMPQEFISSMRRAQQAVFIPYLIALILAVGVYILKRGAQ